MIVAMVKHNDNGKSYFFEIPFNLERHIMIGTPVICDTKIGMKSGIVVHIYDHIDESITALMESAGAKFPLKRIININGEKVSISSIKIPYYMANSTPRDSKIAKRFIEYYHNKKFNTKIIIKKDGTLVDGYTAYLVAKFLGLDSITITYTEEVI